jgi:Na+/H+ antiporter NhaD/arsenite permease-like protein
VASRSKASPRTNTSIGRTNPLNTQNPWLTHLARDWLLAISVAGLIASCVWLKKVPVFTVAEGQVLFILFILMVSVKGLEHCGLFSRLAWHVERGTAIPLKLVVLTFFLSMLVTNDVALIVIVPLTLILKTDRRDLLVILEAVAANAGSALTPFGNPQNLYIYWYYDIGPAHFTATIAPLAGVLFLILAVAASLIKTRNGTPAAPAPAVQERPAYGFALLLIMSVLVVLRLLPLYAGVAVIVGALFIKRSSLRVDYGLLAVFVCFFGIAENVKTLIAPVAGDAGRVFMIAALSSQVISNVPAALLFAKTTDQWQALLWGTNAGGFGSVVGSLANLIAYRLYIGAQQYVSHWPFTVKFLVIGYTAFLISAGLYYLVAAG